MAKRKYSFTEQKIVRFLKQGRGAGRGKDYKPFLTVFDLPSHGLSCRMLSRKYDRVHHLFSTLERSAFLIYDWDDRIEEIREQFPLPRELTRRLARQMGIRHPRDPRTKVDIVVTTDQVLSLRHDGREILVPRAIKMSSALNSRRTVEKLELERAAWRELGWAWGLLTEKELPRTRSRNLQWLSEMRSLDHVKAPYPHYWQHCCEQVMLAIHCADHDISLRRLLGRVESTGHFRKGEPLMALRHLTANKQLLFNLDEPFDIRRPARTFQVSPVFVSLLDSVRRAA